MVFLRGRGNFFTMPTYGKKRFGWVEAVKVPYSFNMPFTWVIVLGGKITENRLCSRPNPFALSDKHSSFHLDEWIFNEP
jgi:hypothetical protein